MGNPSNSLAVAKRIAVAASVGIGPVAACVSLLTTHTRYGIAMADLARLDGSDFAQAFGALLLWPLFTVPVIWILYGLTVYVLDPARAKAAWSRPEPPQADPAPPPPVAPPNRLYLFLEGSLIIAIFGGLWAVSHLIPAASQNRVPSLQELQAQQEAEIASGLRDPVTNRRLSAGRLKSMEELYAETMAQADPNAHEAALGVQLLEQRRKEVRAALKDVPNLRERLEAEGISVPPNNRFAPLVKIEELIETDPNRAHRVVGLSPPAPKR
jgi:hypothetical protein